MNKNIFREYDIRGVADRDLTDEVAEGIGRAYVAMLGGEKPKVAVAIDCRVSGPRLHDALVRGLVKAGAHVVDAGMGPTPFLYFTVNHLSLDGGIMVTGSHNPGDENGFKMMRGKASFFGADIQKLRERIEKKDFGSEVAPGSVEHVKLEEAYLAALTAKLRKGPHAVPVVLDAGNGAGGPLGLQVLRKAGYAPVDLFCEMDGTFPNHHPDPTVPKNLEALVAKVKETGARVGLPYDGDADRLGAVDEKGEIIWGDKLLILFSRALFQEHPGATVIGEVKCSQTLYDDIAKHGGKPLMWKTGHSLIKTKMKETHALLAGEMSGHLFFADRYFGYDDALYAGLRLLEILAHDPRPLSEMLADVPKTFSTPELRVDCPDGLKFDVVARVLAHFRAANREVSDVDGARIQFGTPGAPAWGLVRASNTGPILVMRFEAASEAQLAAVRSEVESVVTEERKKLGA